MFNLPMSPMSISLMQGAQAAPQAAQPNNLQAFMGNPLTSIGMGLLGGNYGTNSREAFANAMRGGLLGMQQARVGQIQQEQLAAQRAELKRQQDEETQMRQWAQSKGLDPNMPEWALKAQYEQEMKSKYPSSAQFGTSAHMFVNQQNPKDVIIGQMSTSGGAYTFDSQGKPIPIDPTKYMYHKPLSIQNFGDRVGAINTLTAQGMPIGSGYPSQGGPIPQPNMNPMMPPMGSSQMQTPNGPVMMNNTGQGNPAEWHAAINSVQQSAPSQASGMISGDPTTGRIGTSPDQSPQLKAEQAAASKAAEIKATTQAQAQVDLPGAEMDLALTKDYINELRNHPGLDSATGLSGAIIPVIPGTSRADFEARKEQLLGGSFLQAYQQLKGGGQITEVEGKKAENAIARMQTAVSKSAFLAALKDYERAIDVGFAKLRIKAGASSPSAGGWSIKKVD